MIKNETVRGWTRGNGGRRKGCLRFNKRNTTTASFRLKVLCPISLPHRFLLYSSVLLLEVRRPARRSILDAVIAGSFESGFRERNLSHAGSPVYVLRVLIPQNLLVMYLIYSGERIFFRVNQNFDLICYDGLFSEARNGYHLLSRISDFDD